MWTPCGPPKYPDYRGVLISRVAPLCHLYVYENFGPQLNVHFIQVAKSS